MKVLVVVAVLGMFLIDCSSPGRVSPPTGTTTVPSASPSGSSVLTRPISSSGLILHGRVRCTATLQTPMHAGHETGLTFALHNLTDDPVKVSVEPWDLTFVLKAADGTNYDTGGPPIFHSVPYRPPTEIEPGTTKILHGADVWVRWAGPLSITPDCSGTALPALRTDVVAPGPAPAEPMAIADVVAAMGPLLDRCTPLGEGVPVQGWIDPPNGNAPSMRAECSITLQRQGSFLVGQVLVLIPPELSGVHVGGGPYELVALPEWDVSAEVVAWDFVVTADGAVLVASSSAGMTRPADVMAPLWGWTGTRWEGGGESRCGGGWGSGGGSGGMDVGIEFISVCPP